jgi:hypothetical protein
MEGTARHTLLDERFNLRLVNFDAHRGSLLIEYGK